MDFDGTLVPLRDVHYEALNKAIAEVDPKFVITPEEHTSAYDGLSTKRKLAMLTETKGFPADAHARVYERKQALTIDTIETDIKHDQHIVDLLTELRSRGYRLVLASNAVQPTVQAGLMAIGAWKLFDRIYTNEDVDPKRQKPCPDMYLQCMVDAGVAPDETLIIEDSKHGREAARRSGAFVCGVDSPADLTLEKVERALNAAQPKPKRWVGGNINVVIPMSGLGSRFAAAGYTLPKPLIDVAGKSMIERVVRNIGILGQYIFIVQKQHYDQYNLGNILQLIMPDCKIIQVDGITDGACCTTLLAKKYIDNNSHLIIANSDQWVDYDPCDFMWSMISNNIDGGILTFTDNHPKWSYVKTNNHNIVNEVMEKKVISNQATCGIYYWTKGSMYVKYAEQMIENNIRYNNEFYVAPVYQEAIKDGKKIKAFSCQKMVGLGTPEDLDLAIKNHIFQ